eukprot:g16583.t1
MRRAMQFMMTPGGQGYQGDSAPSSTTGGGDAGVVGPYGGGAQKDAAAAKRIAVKERKQFYKEKQKAQQLKDKEKLKAGAQTTASKKAEAGGEANQDGSAGPGYVDLAAQRRAQEGELAKTLEKFQTISAEESKYMGGDAEHTHWVKGLDEALLAQRRKEIQREQVGGKTDADTKILEQRAAVRQVQHEKKASKSLLAQRVETALVKSLHPDQIGFRTNLNKMHQRLYGGDRVKSGPATFLPQRTFYCFATGLYDIEERPVYGTRSKDECPKVDERFKCEYLDRKLLAHLKETMQEFKANKKLRKKGLLGLGGGKALGGGGGNSSAGSMAGDAFSDHGRDANAAGERHRRHGGGAGSTNGSRPLAGSGEHAASSSSRRSKHEKQKSDDIFGGSGSFADLLKSTVRGAAVSASSSKQGLPGVVAKARDLEREKELRDRVRSTKAGGGRARKKGGGSFFDQLDESSSENSGLSEDNEQQQHLGGGDGDEFLPSRSYKGSRRGYIFTTKERGTGYYKDHNFADTAAGIAERAQERRREKEQRLRQLTEGLGRDSDAYGQELSADPNHFRHDKETIAAQIQEEEEWDKLSKKKQKKLAARMEQDTTDGAKFFASRGQGAGGGAGAGEQGRKFKSVDQELDAINKLKEGGKLRKFGDMETAQPAAKRSKLF